MNAPIPFVTEFDFEYGRIERVSANIRRIVAKNPGPFTYTGTNVYLIGSGDVAVIDPGPDMSDHLDALLAALPGERISHIVITHTHKDHCAAARPLQARTGAPIYAFRPHGTPQDKAPPALEEGVDFGFRPDHQLADGDILEGSDWRLRALHTPGHVGDHLCFALDEAGALFTGDHVMGWSTSVIIPPDGDMGDYLDSLEKLLRRDDRIYLPTHGAPIVNPRRYVRAIIGHRKMRDRQILDRLARGPARVEDLVAVMYAGLDDKLRLAASLSVYAHLRTLEKRSKVTARGAASLSSTFMLAR